jgi:hypothetical protein
MMTKVFPRTRTDSFHGAADAISSTIEIARDSDLFPNIKKNDTANVYNADFIAGVYKVTWAINNVCVTARAVTDDPTQRNSTLVYRVFTGDTPTDDMLKLELTQLNPDLSAWIVYPPFGQEPMDSQIQYYRLS